MDQINYIVQSSECYGSVSEWENESQEDIFDWIEDQLRGKYVDESSISIKHVADVLLVITINRKNLQIIAKSSELSDLARSIREYAGINMGEYID